MTTNKIWTKDFINLSAMNFFLILVYFLLNATITTYAVNEFDATAGESGLIAGIFIIGALVGRIITGRLVLSKKILMFGLFFFILTVLLYFLNLGIYFLMLTRFLNGISVGIATTIVGTVVALVIPNSRRGEGISYFAVSTALATGIGPFIGLLLTQNGNYNLIFLFSLVLGCIILGTSFIINVPQMPLESNVEKKSVFSNFIDYKTIPIAIILFIMTFSFSSILSYINLYATEMNLVSTASFFFMVYTASVLISRPFTGRLVDRKGANIIMYPAIVLFGLGMILLSFTESSMTLLLSGVLVGLGFGNITSITQTVAISQATPQRVAMATATFMIFYDLGNGFGPTLLGGIIPFTGYSGMYQILAVIIFLSLILYYFLHGRKAGIRQKQAV
ncbi:MFS transporter [Terribacillus saccharophilus]|uniref:MFS transporter n=1 Tax=Terribacillus saccharophilus TaxID=361277 RepID=A0A268A9G6_9BACI|nr:MFS transporter [Terribacillus saccharophilus]PAD20762.1 MFS transporter [Terribacillus saccharophilus]